MTSAIGRRPSAARRRATLAAAVLPFPQGRECERAVPPSGPDDGSVGVLLLAVASVTLLVALAVTAAGQFMVGHAAAEAAADAAALAAAPVTFRPFGAAGSPAQEAARFAAANDAVVVACACRADPSWEPRTVVVTVRRTFPVVLFGERAVEATSRAEFIPTRLLAPVG